MSVVAGVPNTYIETRDLLIKAEGAIEFCAAKLAERSYLDNLDRIREISSYVSDLLKSSYIYGDNGDASLEERFEVVFSLKDQLYAHAGVLLMTSFTEIGLPIDALPYVRSVKGSAPFSKAKIVCIADENHHDREHQHNIWACLNESLQEGDVLYREGHERNKPVSQDYSLLVDDVEKSVTHLGWDDMELFDIYKMMKKQANDKWNAYRAVTDKIKQANSYEERQPLREQQKKLLKEYEEVSKIRRGDNIVVHARNEKGLYPALDAGLKGNFGKLYVKLGAAHVTRDFLKRYAKYGLIVISCMHSKVEIDSSSDSDEEISKGDEKSPV